MVNFAFTVLNWADGLNLHEETSARLADFFFFGKKETSLAQHSRSESHHRDSGWSWWVVEITQR